jgi:uncharacterized membrane protein YcaP (DUF421 family)
MHVDLAELFALHVPPLELILRGTLVYWLLLLLFRFVLRREAGSLGVADILLVVIIADAAQNGMAGSYQTVSEGAVLVVTLVLWNFALDAAAYRWPAVHWLTDPPPLQLIKDGQMLMRNLRKEYLTREDVEAQLRQAGIEDVACVRAAYLEGDGKLSVLPYDPGQRPQPQQRDDSAAGT